MQLRSSTKRMLRSSVVKVHQQLETAYQARTRQRRTLIILALLILLLYFLSIMPGTVQQLAELVFFLSLYFLGIEIIVLALFMRQPDRIRRLESENQRRQSAAYAQYAGSHEENTLLPLVIPQPIGDASALPLPMIIQSRPYRWILVAIMSLVLSIIIFISILLFFLAYWATSARFPLFYQILDLPTTITTVIVVFLVIGILFLWLVSRTSPGQLKLEITEEGFTLQKRGQSKKKRFISWSDARLLAIEGYPGRRSQRRVGRLYYELASEREGIRWLSSIERYRGILHNSQGQEIRPEEYQRIMQALLSVITAKTNLPLYDLS